VKFSYHIANKIKMWWLRILEVPELHIKNYKRPQTRALQLYQNSSISSKLVIFGHSLGTLI